MSNIEINNKKVIDIVKDGLPYIGAVMYRTEEIQGSPIRDLIPYSLTEGAEEWSNIVSKVEVRFVVDSFSKINKWVSYSQIVINISGYFSELDPRNLGDEIYFEFTTGDFYSSTYKIASYGGAAYDWSASWTIYNVTANYQTNDFFAPNYVALKKYILWEEPRKFTWEYRDRQGFTGEITNYPGTYDYLYPNETSELTVDMLNNAYPPSFAFYGKVAAKYVGYGPRIEFGLDGDPYINNYIYDFYHVVEGSGQQIPPIYKWVFKERVEVIAYSPSFDIDEYDIFGQKTVGEDFSESVLNNFLEPNENNVGTIARDWVGVRIDGSIVFDIYDYWEIQKIIF